MDGEVPAEQPPADMEAMGGMEDAMEPAMEEAMDGAMEAAMEGAEGEAAQADATVAEEKKSASQDMEDKIDFSADERMRLFIEHCAEVIEAFKEEEHWTDEHYHYVNDFLNDPDQKCLFIWCSFEEEKKLKVSNVKAPDFYGMNIMQQDYQVAYFMKRKRTQGLPITISNIKEAILFKSVGTDPMEDLLETMKTDYAKKLLADNSWPDGVRKEFMSSLHQFMAFLNVSTYEARGQTYLYIPEEDLNDEEAASKDKDLLQRLESTVIQWTRQIKDLVSNQDSPSGHSDDSPLDEIAYWKKRTANLNVLNQRLKMKELKQIINVLEAANSSYLEQFQALEKKIKIGFEESQDNLQFLDTLGEPCRKIEQAKPKDIPKILPEALNCVRIIFELSQHYNTMERMKSLLTKISNQIIKQCRAKINKDDMLSGDVEKCMDDLQESIECCKQWKIICQHHQAMIKKYSPRAAHWTLDNDDTIFAENEAFIQRCRDLMEICEGQLQFARKGAKQVMPKFGGVMGDTYTQNLLELEKEFAKNLQNIKNLKYDILNVKITRWHDDYGQFFKEQCKNLETKYHNNISLAFKNVSSVQDAVEMLENFDSLAKRPLVKDYVHKKAAEMVWKMFQDEIREIEETFEEANKRQPPMPFSHPKHGGIAIWAQSLIVRVDKAYEAMQNLYFIPESQSAREANEKYQKLKVQLDQFIAMQTFQTWKDEIKDFIEDSSKIDQKLDQQVLTWSHNRTEEVPQQVLQSALFARSKKNGLLESNFDSNLHKILAEVTYWQKISALGYCNIPHPVAKLYARKEQLRITRESVMLIVRDYNNIKHMINQDEQALFSDHLQYLEKTIDPGIKRHNWGSSIDNFVYNCRRECQDVFANVQMFQNNQQKIQDEFEKISSTCITNIQKTIYLLTAFITQQEDTLEIRKKDLITSFDKVIKLIMSTYNLFIRRKNRIQGEWLKFIHRLDDSLLKSLQNSVQITLLDLHKRIIGDPQRQELIPIFKIYTILQTKNDTNWTIIHDPSHDDLLNNINMFMQKIIQVTNVVPRIEKIFREKRAAKILEHKEKVEAGEKEGKNMSALFAEAGIDQSQNYQNKSPEEKELFWQEKLTLPRNMEDKPEYVDRIAKKSKIKNKRHEITEGVQKIQTNMEEDRKRWQASPEIRFLSNMRTERGKRRILRVTAEEDGEDPVLRYKESIESVNEILIDINNKSGHQAEGFIIIDCSMLKTKLLQYGQEFITRIIGNLVDESKNDLSSLLNEFDSIAHDLTQPPTKLEHLKKNKDLMAEVIQRLPQMGGKREPIKKKFAYIQELIDMNEGKDIELTPEEKMKLDGIDDAWSKFNDDLEKAKQIINRCHQSLKTEVDNQIEDFKKECQDNKKNFQLQAPYQVDKSSDNKAAFDKIQEFKNATQDLRDQEEAMKFGLEIFEIEPTPYPELSTVEKETDLLTKIWQVKDEWDNSWEQWKEIPFYGADFEEGLRNDALDFKDTIEKKIDKDVRDWGVYNYQKQQIQLFLDTCELLANLQTPAMRERHWKEIRFEVKADFDETADDFNLEKLFSLDLLSHQDKIQELVDNAKKQLKIEEELNKIEKMWMEDKKSNLDIEKHTSKADNEQYYFIKSTDVIMEIIEEHGTMLGSHKSSPYYKEFDTKIDYWEQAIAQITETLEILLQVQSKWKYLESIFKGQPDISKQLPNEDAIFRRNHVQFKEEMERINKDKNCKKALTEKKNFLQELYELNDQFEKIQKYLKQFLESKRSQFPRFYFLSDEDLLEIIGQSKDPKPILQHIRKMFEGVHTLDINESNSGSRGQKGYEIAKLVNDDEETVELQKPINVTAKVESWLNGLILEMKESLKKCFFQYHTKHAGQKKALEREKLLKIIQANQGQILLTISQMQWTLDVKNALIGFEQQDSNSQVRACKKKYMKKVESYVELIEKSQLGGGKEGKRTRSKIVSLIIIDQHNYEIITQIVDKKVKSHKSFEWQQQLRFRKASEENEKMIIACEQLSCIFDYGYEYQGNNGRLVVTPLTDRAYMTLTYALNLHRGGAPQGPAGTGKTETVKDLGKNLAFYVVIQNCSDQMDVVSLAKIFAGLALSGAWGCFDEFNRIEVEVLSVVAQQVQILLDAIKKKETSTPFGEMTLKVDKNTGLFITMNPGYAGRSELPDNLACLFRPVAMMKPDLQAIVMITLKSEGFKTSEVLAKKVVTIYDLMARQLSKQSHYDYGMRAIKSVLNASGRIKRENKDMDETTVIIKALRDMNLPKFLADDVILFDNLFMDLFPDCEEAENDNDDLQIAIEEALIKRNLQLNENIVVKTMQLFESKATRHGNMLVGATLSGKTTVWQILMDALNQLNQEEKERGVKPDDYKYRAVKPEVINPKAISCDELFGCLNDAQPPEWQDGILSNVLKVICKEKIEARWMILDGPIDTLWIETLNSVLDDNKLLTLTNGDRIALTPNVKLLFEVENLDVASPATVSRAGMVYLDIEELGWEPYVTMWIEGKASKGAEFQEMLTSNVSKYINRVLDVKRLQCTELVRTSNTATIVSMTKLFDALCHNLQRGPEEDRESYRQYVEKWFVFCLIWSIGCTVDEDSRKAIDFILREIESMFPHTFSVFEYFLHPEKRDWAPWEERLQANWKPTTNEFNKINVPTVDTTRNRYIVQSLLEAGSQVLLVGHSGVGKTVLIDGILISMDQNISYFTINFSAGTTSAGTQDIIENNFERRAKNKYKPKNAKIKSVCFIDDLNMPRKDTFGSQPPLELMRQWIDYEFWYNRLKIEKNFIQDLQFLSAMGKPGGGRAEISNRILSKFHLINFTVPSELNMKRIYETIASHKFATFDEDIRNQSESLAIATISLFFLVQKEFLPTPAKPHYIFNMRDVSKVFQGIYLADSRFYEGKENIVKLWVHELLRVFSDRLNTHDDKETFKKHINDQLTNVFQLSYEEHGTTEGQDSIFVDFLNDQADVYVEVEDFAKLRDKLNEVLEAYNRVPKLISMDLVLFKDAITHVCKIYRIFQMKAGHAFLVGVGGSGRHSLTRLAAFIQEMNVSQIEIVKGFNLKSFREFIKEMYVLAGYKGKTLKTVFIFSDNDVVYETFLEDIQNMLNSGVVPNLYSNDEMAQLRDVLRRPFKRAVGGVETPENLDAYFFGNIKDNMHLSICFSPIGQAFKDYCKQYPALINNTTIDWFLPWPKEALYEVAKKFIAQMDDLCKKEEELAELCAYTHFTTQTSAEMMKNELNRVFYVTPTNYLELLKGYGKILGEKREAVDKQRNKLRSGLSKLDDARRQVELMAKSSDEKRIEVQKENKACEELMIRIAKERAEAEAQEKNIKEQTEKIEKEKEDTLQQAADVQAELKKCEPALIMAQEAIDKLDKKYIAEIKAFTTPPPDVQTTMSAVMILLQKEPTWPSAKKELSDSGFIKKIMEFDKDNISPKVLAKIEKFTRLESFQPALVSKCNVAAGALCQWVRSLEDYSKALKVVAPKRARMAHAQEQLAKKEAMLKELTDQFEELMAKLNALEEEFQEADMKKKRLQESLQELQILIDRGDKLVQGLSGEKTRWEAQIIELDDQFLKLIGDSILSAAFMSYCGPFPSEYRDELISNWITMVQTNEIPYSNGFSFADFMADAAQQRQWQVAGLPTDKFSTENGCFVTRGLRWALNIDPQTQCMKWIKNTYPKDLIIADTKDPKHVNKIVSGVRMGLQVLFIDVGETIDPILDNILNRSLIQVGKNLCVKVGDDEIEYDQKFSLYITTRMPNPHYTPEISSKVAIVNFTVKESGLEEQCVGIVVSNVNKQLEKSKNEQITKIAENKQEIKNLEDLILRMLQESEGNLLENVKLIDTLQESKEKSDIVKETLQQAEILLKKVDDTREVYRACGRQASILYFVLNDLNKINSMYQFSLDWYKDLFDRSIKDVENQAVGGDKIEAITAYHTKHVYKEACKSLFEKHKLLLSMQMCIKLQMSQGVIDQDEWNFFLIGGQVLDRTLQPPKPPFDWISQNAWDNITELEKAIPETFQQISNSVTTDPKNWDKWYHSVKPHPPERAALPGEWDSKCEGKLKKMIVLRCFREDRVNYAIRDYVEHFMKKDFVESVPVQLKDVIEESSPKTPLIIVLSPGVDPTDQLKRLAEEKGVPFETISMGKGQAQRAEQILTTGADVGNWIFLANCHLSISMLPDLEGKIDELFKLDVDPNFRLILSANPHPDFSISLLQRSIKITQEPPKGIKANMLRLYGQKSEFTSVEKSREFRKAVYGLCFFHTLLIERKKFQSLGWNVNYAFNESDYSVCEDILAIYMGQQNEEGKPIDESFDKKHPIPWPAIQSLIADCNYGGRITDNMDRRLIGVYAKEIFNDGLVALEKWKPNNTDDTMNYSYPFDEAAFKHPDLTQVFTPQYFYEEILNKMDDLDPPQVYGQHINAEISSQINDSKAMLYSILSITPQKGSGGGDGGSAGVVKLIRELQEKVPELVDYFRLKQRLRGDENPLNVVLLQEVSRYAVLIKQLAKQLVQLERGSLGLEVISQEGEDILEALQQNKVPAAWSYAYFSLKPLANWFQDLNDRYEFFQKWAAKGIPLHFWIGAFTYPTGFTTSVLQKFSRYSRTPAPIDRLEFDFIPIQKQPHEITEPPKDGAYITKLYIEGGAWDHEKHCLAEPEVMQLAVPLPVMHFKPIQKRAKPPLNTYKCPTYYYPIRQGSVAKDSYMLDVDLKSGEKSPDFWVLRGTALLMSLAS